MSGGLSTMNFMGGLMQGASFVNGMQQQQRANDRADEQFSMQKEKFGMEKEDRENKQLLVDFDRDSRALAESGKAPDQGFWKKYSGLGINKLESDEQREELMQAGTLMHRAVAENQWDERSLDGINLMLKDDLAARTKTDGMARRIVGAKEVPTGKDADGDGVEDVRMVPILEVTKKDGTKYTAPLTRNGTGDPDDDIYTINDQKINEWHEAALHRANMAYALQKTKNDPKAFAAQLRNIVLGKQASADAYELRDIYDDKTGTKRAAAIRKSDGQFSHWLGGASVNDGKGSGSGKGRNKTGAIDTEEYLKQAQEIRTSTTFMDESERASARNQLDQDYFIQWGATPQEVQHYIQVKRNAGDFKPLTYEELAAMQVAVGKRQADGLAVDGAIAENPAVFGGQPNAGVGLSDVAQKSAPPPLGMDKYFAENQAKIEQLQATATDPSLPDGARAAAENELTAAQAEKQRLQAGIEPDSALVKGAQGAMLAIPKALGLVNAAPSSRAPAAPPVIRSPKEKRDLRIAQLQQAIAGTDNSLQAAAYAKEMADLMAANNSNSQDQLAGF